MFLTLQLIIKIIYNLRFKIKKFECTIYWLTLLGVTNLLKKKVVKKKS